MKGLSLRIRLVACVSLLVVAGCISPQNTRLPTLGFGDPRAERRAYEYHDPSPERETGPLVERPRGFERQRPEPIRVQEHHDMSPSLFNQGGTDEFSASSAARYPNTVRP